MNFSVAVKEFALALGRISSATPQRSPMQVLENILMHLDGSVLSLTATDMDIVVTTRIDVRGEGNGSILVPAKRLIDTVRALELGDLRFEADLGTMRITLYTGSGQYKLTGLNAVEFPQLPQFEAKASLKLPLAKFASMIDRTVFACSGDEFRPAMTGVLFQFRPDEIRAIATDGFRLVRVIDHDMAGTGGDQLDIIVPPKALNLASKAFSADEITLEANQTHVRFADGVTTITARLIDENYPNYESVIPQANDKRMVIRREELLNTVKRVSLYSNSQTRQVRMRIASEGLRVQAEDMDTGGEAYEQVPCDYNSDELEIGFNSQYVRDALDRIDTADVAFDFSTPLRPSLITPHGDKNGQDVLMLLMPIRLNN
ncbi:MAG: DNA polymerase III subunit beta [Bacteroidetes bacterium]|nr:DNA polymerase III subunit beta [Bacteroidota bacterium]